MFLQNDTYHLPNQHTQNLTYTTMKFLVYSYLSVLRVGGYFTGGSESIRLFGLDYLFAYCNWADARWQRLHICTQT